MVARMSPMTASELMAMFAYRAGPVLLLALAERTSTTAAATSTRG
jgi:hypothetical protein